MSRLTDFEMKMMETARAEGRDLSGWRLMLWRCWSHLKFLVMWMLAAVFVAVVLREWNLSSRIALLAGFCIVLLWKLWGRIEDNENSLANQLRELYSYIEDPESLHAYKRLASETLCLKVGILEKKIIKGMTPEEIEQVLRDYGVENPNMLRREVDSKSNVHKEMCFEPRFGDPTPWIELIFTDRKLSGWNAGNYGRLSAERGIRYAAVNKLSRAVFDPTIRPSSGDTIPNSR